MSDRLSELREAINRPLRLAYNPVYRFYEGGSLTRSFRGLTEREDDRWSEDWVGSCTYAGNPDPAGGAQGLSAVELDGIGTITLKDLVEALPEEMVGVRFVERWGPITGVLVKLLSPRGRVPARACASNARMGAAAPWFSVRKDRSVDLDRHARRRR